MTSIIVKGSTPIFSAIPIAIAILLAPVLIMLYADVMAALPEAQAASHRIRPFPAKPVYSETTTAGRKSSYQTPEIPTPTKSISFGVSPASSNAGLVASKPSSGRTTSRLSPNFEWPTPTMATRFTAITNSQAIEIRYRSVRRLQRLIFVCRLPRPIITTFEYESQGDYESMISAHRRTEELCRIRHTRV